jgi:hypothetical protein
VHEIGTRRQRFAIKRDYRPSNIVDPLDTSA